jgi:hypothetical protein
MIQGRQKVKKWPKIMPKILKRAKRAKMDQNEDKSQNGQKGSRAQTGQEPKELKWPNGLILPKRGKLLKK